MKKNLYSYNRRDSTLAIVLLGFLIAAPFIAITKMKNRQAMSCKKTFAERLEESRKRSFEALKKTRQRLWDTVKNKKLGESDAHYVKRLKRYGFAPNGVHIKTGINYQLDTVKETDQLDIASELKKLEGEIFYTKTGVPFRYYFAGENVIRIAERKPYNISLLNFQKALELNLKKSKKITYSVRGASYVFGIITDKRFGS